MYRPGTNKKCTPRGAGTKNYVPGQPTLQTKHVPALVKNCSRTNKIFTPVQTQYNIYVLQ
jgi:hypothetical protein